MMDQRDKAIFELFCRKVRERLPEARIYAYGSRARGDHEEDSDLDVCVVIPVHDEESRKIISYVAWEVGFENDLLIQTIVFSSLDFEQGPWSISPIVRVIKKEGLAA